VHPFLSPVRNGRARRAVVRSALMLLALPTSASAASPDLGAGAQQFAGAAVSLDSRLAGRTCPPQGFRFDWVGSAVEARCPATGERLLLPVRAQTEPQRLKRGETVQADYVGSGFRISVGAVADGSSPGGRVTLRNSRSGQRFGARLDQSGRIIVSDFED
jgi:hypothetical protein